MDGPTESSRTGRLGYSTCWPSCIRWLNKPTSGPTSWSTAWSPCSPKEARRIPFIGAPSSSSQVYRLWACIRASTMRAWLAKAKVLRPKGAGCAADWQAYELALIIADSRAK
eukprot:10604735-Heterocapsa_arctica.AAC.1